MGILIYIKFRYGTNENCLFFVVKRGFYKMLTILLFWSGMMIRLAFDDGECPVKLFDKK